MITYAFDSNILSYLLNKNQDIYENYRYELKKGNTFNISPVVYYEVKRGLKANNSIKKANEFNNLCLQFEIGKIDINVWDEAVNIYVELKKQGKLIEDADILIAAYCIVNDYTLITNNIEHFGRVNNLKYVNWK